VKKDLINYLVIWKYKIITTLLMSLDVFVKTLSSSFRLCLFKKSGRASYKKNIAIKNIFPSCRGNLTMCNIAIAKLQRQEGGKTPQTSKIIKLIFLIH
jgi:hypothetical protein